MYYIIKEILSNNIDTIFETHILLTMICVLVLVKNFQLKEATCLKTVCKLVLV